MTERPPSSPAPGPHPPPPRGEGPFAPLSLAVLIFLLPVPSVLASSARAPLTRSDIRSAEARLAELGYWTGPVDGVWDGASRQALIAFQRLRGAKATGVLTRA